MIYEIKTEIAGSTIIQELRTDIDYEKWDGIKTELFRWIIDTRDKEIREALIKLGWTPPHD